MLHSVFFRAWTWLANIDQILSSTTQADDTSMTTKEHQMMTGKRSTGGAGVGGDGTGTSLSIDPPRPPPSASTSSSAGPRQNAGSFLGIGRDKERERERERIRAAERADPSAELLAMEDDNVDSPMSAAFDYTTASSPPSAYATARPRTRSDRPFSVSTWPGSSSSHSSHLHSSHSSPSTSTLQVVRSLSRLSAGGEGGVTTRLSGWFSHISGSTSDLSLTSISSSARKALSSSSSCKSDTLAAEKAAEAGSSTKQCNTFSTETPIPTEAPPRSG
ncbi:hypothetical protein C8F01DRAFT_1232387 [Mycena amicta]|nr:hypothetical protein C8F01DRAFT_1232387 [Mycena amicta]